MNFNCAPEDEYDVIIIGGALAGAATGCLLRRENSGLRVLIVERSEVFERRVGEATVEVSGYFLTRVLGLTAHLNESHFVKQGFRFWFQPREKDAGGTARDSSEIGGSYLARVPAFLVDRAVLDEEVLGKAKAIGCELMRPARVVSVELKDGARQRVQVEQDGGRKELWARWVVDASGPAAFLARSNSWLRQNIEHPTCAAWARWKGVKNFDDLEWSGSRQGWAARTYGMRSTATNHFMGQGWWAWFIPLKGGDVSVGMVFDERLVAWPKEGTVAEKLRRFLDEHPVAREMLQDAEPVAGDVHWRRRLAYRSERFAGEGFVLVGDAGAFLDPLYSPGMDWLAFSVCKAVELVCSREEKGGLGEQVKDFNDGLGRSYERWFQAVYRDKYVYLGDYELMRVGFLLDLGFYYLGIASQPYRLGARALRTPVFSNRPSTPFFYLMRCYNRRLSQMAVARQKSGRWGRCNGSCQFMFGGYTFGAGGVLSLARALAGWLWLEIKEGWRSWGREGARPVESAAVCGSKLEEVKHVKIRS